MSESRREDSASHLTRPWWPPADWTLRRKVAAALALPVIVAAIFAGLRVQGALVDARAASDAQTRYGVLKPAMDYLADVQDLTVLVASPASDQGAIDASRARVSESLKTLQASAVSSDLTQSQSDSLAAAITAGLAFQAGGSDAAERMAMVSMDVSHNVAAAIHDLYEARDATRLTPLLDIVTAQGHLTHAQVSLAVPKFDAAARAQVASAAGGEIDALTRLQAAEVPGVDVEAALASPQNRLNLVATGTPQDLAAASTSIRASYEPLYNAAIANAQAGVAKDAETARWTAILQAGIVLGALLLSLVVGLFIAQLLIRPVSRLRMNTIDIAQRRLPAAIERVQNGEPVGEVGSVAIDTQEEIGELSRAVDGMQTRAITLATDQARLRRQVTEMFETLSRRSTSLVNQQLNLLEQLERTEDDPDRLDSLFRLDHLAARMRRNGQSLMVLAGSTARTNETRTLSAADVVNASISEVQDYQRVDVGSVPDRQISANVAGDLVHLLAELIDNALSYSPPGSRVDINGARAIDGGVLIEIEDHGLGVDAEVLARLNSELDSGGELTVATARHMGLFVVARLGSKHGIVVRLRAGATHGTITTIQIPAEALAVAERPAAPAPAAQSAATSPKVPEPARPLPSRTPAANWMPPAAPSASTQPTPPPSEAPAGLPRRQPGATGVSAFTNTSSLQAPPVVAQASAGPNRVGVNGDDADKPEPDPDGDGPDRPGGARPTAVKSPDGTPSTRPASQQVDGVRPDRDRATANASFFNRRDALSTPAMDENKDKGDTPIFNELRSRWLSGAGDGAQAWASEATDESWQAARLATEAPRPAEDGALPKRRPGRLVVPGTIDRQSEPEVLRPTASAAAGAAAAEAAHPARDAEALRASLNGFRDSVARGRQAGRQNDQTHDQEKWAQ